MKRTLKEILWIDKDKLMSSKLSKSEAERLIKDVDEERKKILSRTNTRIG